MFGFLAQAGFRAVVVRRSGLSIALGRQALYYGVRQRSVSIFSLCMLPSVHLDPIKGQRRAGALALISLKIVGFPRLQSLILQVPYVVLVARERGSLFYAKFFLIAASTTRYYDGSVFVRHLFWYLYLRSINMLTTMVGQVSTALCAILISVLSRIGPGFLYHLVARLGRFLRFPYHIRVWG